MCNIMIQGYDVKKRDPEEWQKCRIKLIDFGLSKYKYGNQSMNTKCGTIDFMAPEVLMNEQYDENCDMWSLGVIAYFLLTGVPPFYHDKEVMIKSKILTTDYNFNAPIWETISPECKDWIENLLVRAEQRMNVKQTLQHKWFASEKFKYIHRKNIKIL